MRKALEMALEALDIAQAMLADLKSYHQPKMLQAYTALRQAIEQAQKQEPLCTAAMFDDAFLAKSGLSPDTKLYTSPPQRQPLTDEQIVAINDKHYNLAYRDFDADIAIARAIETAHGIKENTEQDGNCKHCTDGCPVCDARRQPNVLS